jgi:outer membrane protein assembly factor BamB
MLGETLYVSFYHGIATGSSLYAFTRSTGKLLWQADVKQLNVSHSEYYNTVLLSNWKNYIILEGIEAEGHYVQIFNKDTGERLFSTF